MSQVSRPFQIALVAMVLLVMVWFVALRGHGSSAGPASTPAPIPTATSKVYTGAAPGVAGLTGAIAKAHGTVKVHGTVKAGTSAASKSGTAGQGKTSPAAAAQAALTRRQGPIQHELAQGKVVLLMFWNPKSSDDRSVRGQLHAVSRRDGRVAVHVALPSEVGQFGGYTRGVQILQTPTVLVIHKGQATTLTGLTDARSIQQAIGDAMRGVGKAQAPTLTAWVPGSSRGAYIGKVNGLCKKPFSQGGDHFEGIAKKQITSFKAFTAALQTFMSRLRSIGPPAQDRQHIFTLIADFDVGVRDLNKALATVTAGHALAARQLVLEAQVQFDQSTSGLGEYGFTACFPEYAN